MTDRATVSRSLPYRDALARLDGKLAGGLDGQLTSMQAIVDELIGPRHLWWHRCQEAVQAEPNWLLTAHAQDIRTFINDQALNRDTNIMPIGDPAYVVARSLVPSVVVQSEMHNALGELVGQWANTRLLLTTTPPGQGLYAADALSTVEAGLRHRLHDMFSVLISLRDAREYHPAALSMVALTALLLAGLEPRTRPVVRVSVVFAGPVREQNGPGQGVSGVLELREFPAGPEGLFPDPQVMAGARSAGSEFRESLTHAWEVTPWPGTGRCVLWRIVLSDDPTGLPEIDGGSLGAAFALGLRELFRRPRSRRPGRAGLGRVFYGLRPRTAVTGVLKGGERLEPVSGMDAKLHVVRQKRWQLVAPEANRKDVHDAVDRELVKFAASLKQADRYARRWRTGRLATAAALVVVVAVTATLLTRYVASNNRLQTASQLAAVSGTLLNTDVALAQLFAVEAYRLDPDAQTRAALFRAATASPHFVRSLVTAGPVSTTAGSADGRTVAAGTRNGVVELWTLGAHTQPTAQRHTLHFKGAVNDIAIDAHGDTLAAIDAGTVQLWSTMHGTASLGVPADQQPQTVGVSPSGRFAALVTSTKGGGLPPELLVLDRTTGHTAQISLTDFGLPPTAIVFPDDGQLELFDGGYGTWERFSLPGLVGTSVGTVGFGVHAPASAISADGRYISYTNGGSKLPLWTTEGTHQVTTPDRVAQVSGRHSRCTGAEQ